MNPQQVIHQLLYIVFTACIMTVGLVAILGKKPEIHETIVFLFLGWLLCYVIARVIIWLGSRASSVPTP